MKDNDFISQMVNDTIAATDEAHADVLPFATPSNHFVVYANYDESKHCYVIKSKGKSLEIPKNWGPFHNRISQEFMILKGDDQHHFIDILSKFMGVKLEHLKIKLETSSTVSSDVDSHAA